jgi:predicted CoA-substrate-specific enzyme activase
LTSPANWHTICAMITAGVDVGAITAKAAIIGDGRLLATALIPAGYERAVAALKVLNQALARAGLTREQITRLVATGYGRVQVPGVDRTVTEITCHARGAYHLCPDVHTVIDIGGQDSKGIAVGGGGKVLDFVMNDKCAAGTGRFLEVMAHVLGLKLEEMGPLSLTSKNICNISSTCTVFAETEVVSLRAQGKAVEDLIAGIHRSIASRVIIMGAAINLEQETVFTGGVAKNIGVRKALEEAGKLKCIVPEEPQITGALGAALIAQAESKSR